MVLSAAASWLLALAVMSSAYADQSTVPARAANIDIARCLAIVAGTAERDSERCPGFLVDVIAQARQTCRDAGGTLTPQSPANVWAVDVDRDGRPELAFEHDGNVSCEGAWSVFDCGSLGCPKVLYQEHDGTWQPIAQIYADSMESVEVLAPAQGRRYGDLRVGCGGESPCPEYWTYVWSGEQYESERIEVRGFPVDFAHSIHGLHALTGETPLLATPAPDARVTAHYDASTEVEIIGTAVGADYYYVSPCNACESGFVPRTTVRIP